MMFHSNAGYDNDDV